MSACSSAGCVVTVRAGRLVRGGRRLQLRLAATWPRAMQFTAAITRLQAHTPAYQPQLPPRPGSAGPGPWNPVPPARQPGSQARPGTEAATGRSLSPTDQDREHRGQCYAKGQLKTRKITATNASGCQTCRKDLAGASVAGTFWSHPVDASPGDNVVTEAADSASDADSRARHLIQRAFDEARRTGRPDWQTMTIAVLKNRLLDLTHRSFQEKDYGVRTIAEFVRRYPDLLLLDDSSVPPKVSLHTSSVSPPTATGIERSRIRPDLWAAIVDYRSGFTYIWDGEAARAVEDLSAEEAGSQRVLPTLNVEELDAWRNDFLESVNDVIRDDPNAVEQARRWVDNRLGTRYLPASLRTLWNQELKRRVADRLTAWFADQGWPLPPGLLQARPVIRDQAVGADTLRQLILRCVQVMTENELREVNLPPSAVLRAYGTAVPGRSGEEFRRE